MKSRALTVSPEHHLQAEGWRWMLGTDTLPYVHESLLEVSEMEAEAFYSAATELYDMFIVAGQHIIDHNLFHLLEIPDSLIPAIKHSWELDNGWHLYGRFDLAGGLDGLPIKLLEFNADTATCIPETALVQWASLRANGLDQSSQFNSLFEALKEQFLHLKSQNKHSLLVSAMEGSSEDVSNCLVLIEAAKDAGLHVDFELIHAVEFSKDGIFKHMPDGSYQLFDLWFKLVPWEYIAWDEPHLSTLLSDLIIANKVIVLNPPYTLLFQSKGILAILWQLFPDHPLLLQTDFKPIENTKCVRKVLFGREGANVTFINPDGQPDQSTSGDYADQNVIYQAYSPMLQDTEGFTLQAGVFIAGIPSGLGFRRGGAILDNTAQFMGHIVV